MITMAADDPPYWEVKAKTPKKKPQLTKPSARPSSAGSPRFGGSTMAFQDAAKKAAKKARKK
jgi:hypothetical protein